MKIQVHCWVFDEISGEMNESDLEVDNFTAKDINKALQEAIDEPEDSWTIHTKFEREDFISFVSLSDRNHFSHTLARRDD